MTVRPLKSTRSPLLLTLYPLPYIHIYMPTHLVNSEVGVRADDRSAAEVHTLTTSPYPLSSTLDTYLYAYPPG